MGLFDGLFDFAFGKKATPVQTQPTGFETLPQFGKDLLQDIVSQGRGIAGTTSPFAPAPFTQQQLGALERLQAGVQGPPVGDFKFGQRASDVFDQAAGMAPMIQSNIARGVAPITAEETQAGISQYFNPYIQQALEPTLRGIREQGASTLSDIGRLATDAGAFGSGRQALREAEAEKNILQAIGDVTGQGYAQAFQQAAPLAQQQLLSGRSRFLTGAQTGISGQQALSNLGNQLFGARLGMDQLRGTAR